MSKKQSEKTIEKNKRKKQSETVTEENTVVSVDMFEDFKLKQEEIFTKLYNKLLENAASYQELSNTVLDRMMSLNADDLIAQIKSAKLNLDDITRTAKTEAVTELTSGFQKQIDNSIGNTLTSIETTLKRSAEAVGKELQKQRDRMKLDRVLIGCVGILSVVSIVLHFVF